MNAKTILTLALSLCGVAASAQWQRTPTPNDSLQSVKTFPDGSALVSIYAPKAQSVSLAGDGGFVPFGPNAAFTKAENGVWSLRVKDVAKGVYRYHFVVDGVNVYDPKGELAGETSALAYVGDGSEFFAQKNVPHGAVAQRYYYSKTLGTTRRMHVWTPYGYENSTEKLPVFYLIHGGGDTDNSWPGVGAAGFILDNLMAEGKLRPMIVVMPNGSIETGDMAGEVPLFVDDLMTDIIPFIESNYRVIADPAHRALSGLSMGGMETLEALLKHYKSFESFYVLSSGWWYDEKTYPAYQKQLDGIAKDVNKYVKKLVFTMGGPEDIAYKNCKEMLKLFDKAGIKYEYTEAPGGHTWHTWRNNLHDIAPLLFR